MNSVRKKAKLSKLPRLVLPCEDKGYWTRVNLAWKDKQIHTVDQFANSLAIHLGGAPGLRGLKQMFGTHEGMQESFFQRTLPHIIQSALSLEDVWKDEPAPPLLVPNGEVTHYNLRRSLGTSLMANMFLCTFYPVGGDRPSRDCGGDMPTRHFFELLSKPYPSEVAKLRMLVRYFERTAEKELKGEIRISRVRSELAEDSWGSCTAKMLPMEVMPDMVGFEAPEGRNCLHADFANMYIGGGILGGGSVQEEIRFAICPELILCCLLCPRMEDEEAIQVVGAEQFSLYEGYGRGLKDGGPCEDASPVAEDGTVMTAISAIDALDGRMGNFKISRQMRPSLMLRELNKAYAGFQPVSVPNKDAECSEDVFGVIATGNWGCGVFGGDLDLKTLLQWMAASRGGRRLRYFPYDESEFGDRLRKFLAQLEEGKGCRKREEITVGDVFEALVEMKNQKQYKKGPLLETLPHFLL